MKQSNNTKTSEVIAEPQYLLTERQFSSIPLWEPRKKGRGGIVAREKTVSFNALVKGKPAKIFLKIISGGNDGFPNTTDLDIFRAIEQLANEAIQTGHTSNNLLSFSGKEILRAAGKSSTGPSYKELKRCLQKLKRVTFELLGSTNKKEVLLGFNLLDQIYLEGQKKPDGTVARYIEIQFASWYWKSLQAGNCLVIDHALFKRLRFSISKLLHQFLHSQFYVNHGVAMERYEDLAKNWGMTEYSTLSKIREQLDPSHGELKRLGFLESWEYLAFPGTGRKSYQVSWKAGPQWWEALEVQKVHLGVRKQEGGNHLLFWKAPEEEDGQAGKEGLVVSILDLVGAVDSKYVPFWEQAVRDLPLSVIYKKIGDLRERVTDGEKIRNKGAYLMKLFRLEAQKRGLAWGKK